MAASVALLGWDEDPIRVVQDVDWTLDDRADSTNRLEVTTSLAEADGVDAEQEVIFKARRFVVSGIERDRAADRAVLVADEAQAALADVVIVGFKPNNWSLTRAMNAVLADTRWTLGDVNGVRYGQAHFDEITALDALHFLARHQDAHLSFDSLRRRVNITQESGTAHEYVFTYGRQLSNIEKDVQQPQTTVIYPTMADDVALDPVEDYGYYTSQGLALSEAKARFRKEEYWEDSRYEIAENMTRDAVKRLEEEAWPRITYTLTAQATLDVEGVDDFDLAELRLGDTVYVWDQDIDTKLSAEVTAVTTSSDQSQNELTLSTLPASLGDSVESRGYFGDSGRPSSGGPRRSGPQPRPSMPILEQMGEYGIAVTRWNGQDHDGNYETIPQRFGTLLTLVAPLEDGVIPSPNDSSHTFMGSDIESRGGGTSTIGFSGYGEFAIWHQMRGWDGETMSPLSEPLVVDVPPAWDPGPTEDKLEDLDTRVGPALEKSISEAVTQAQSSIDDFQVEWDENWDPDAISGLVERADVLESRERVHVGEGEPDESTAARGITYEWSGTPHASESIKRVDGVEVARNLATNPELDSDTYAWTAFGASMGVTTAHPQMWGRGPGPILEATANGTSTFSVRHDPVPLAGRWLSVHMLVATDPNLQFSDQTWFYDIDGNNIGVNYGQYRTAQFYDGTELHYAVEALEGAVSAEVRLYGRPTAAGDRMWVDRTMIISAADTEAEALAQVEQYFDGDTEDQLDAPATEGTIYYQTDGDEIIAIWRRTTDEWTKLPLRDEAFSSISVGKLVAGDASINEAVAEKFWASTAFIDNGFVRLIQGEMANFDQALIGGVLLKDKAVAANHLTVGLGSDMVADPEFATSWWNIEGPYTVAESYTRDGVARQSVLEVANSDTRVAAKPFKAIAGAQYAMEFDSERSGSQSDNDRYEAFFVGIYSSGSRSVLSDRLELYATTAWQRQSLTFTVPDDPDLVAIEAVWRFYHVDNITVRVANPSLRRVAEGRLIVNGLLQASTAELNDLFFDEAVGNAIAAGSAQFLELDADQIRSNSWTGITATGATFQTHAQANRGVKLTSAGLRGWDSNGDLNFDVSASTGNILATGVFRTSIGGNRAELDPDTYGGRLSFHRGSHIGTLKLNDALNRLEMVYSEGGDPNQDRPNIGVEETRAIVGYRQTQILVGGTTQEDQAIRIRGSIRDSVSFEDYIEMQRGARVRYYDNLNRLTATVGQSPGAGSSSMFQIWLERGSLNVINGGIQVPRAYETTSSTSANVYISSSGWLSRATSASRYKLDQQDLTVSESLLDIPMIDWIDKAETELKAELDELPRPLSEQDQKRYDTISLRRVPGVVAETVAEYGGEQFVTYGPDGQVEEVMYPRLALAQIQVLKRRNEALEERVRALEAKA